MLNYSMSAKISKAKFFAFRNDIDIYTEDNYEDREFYITLFKRLVEEKIKINDIYPIGCKHEVINEYENTKNDKDKSRRKIFIVDGDLDLIIDTNPTTGDNFYVLSAYCIENFLIDEYGAAKLTFYNHGTESLENCSILFDFNNWLSYNSKSLVRLFIHLAFFKEIGGDPELKHATQFLKTDGKEVKLDNDKVEQYVNQLKDKIVDELFILVENAEGYYQERIDQLSSRWPAIEKSLVTIVSGKDYLLPLLQFRLNSIVSKVSLIPKKNIKLFLADNCDLSRLQDLKNFLLN